MGLSYHHSLTFSFTGSIVPSGKKVMNGLRTAVEMKLWQIDYLVVNCFWRNEITSMKMTMLNERSCGETAQDIINEFQV